MSAIRDLSAFNILAAVLLNADYSIFRAALIPQKLVAATAKENSYTNSFRFMLTDDIWSKAGVVDATAILQKWLNSPSLHPTC